VYEIIEKRIEKNTECECTRPNSNIFSVFFVKLSSIMPLENQTVDLELFDILSDRITKLNESLQKVVQETCFLVKCVSSLQVKNKTDNAKPIDSVNIGAPDLHDDTNSTSVSNPIPSTTSLLPPPIIKPRFSASTSDVHPVDFIQQLDDYLAMFQGDEQQKLKIVMTCLAGDARVFARAFRDSFSTFDEFKAVFLEHFWGLDKQRSLRQRLTNGVYQMTRGVSHMKTYFLRWLAKVKNLKVVPTDRVFLLEITQHFPETVQRALKSFGDGTITSALRVLDEEDHLVNEKLRQQQALDHPDSKSTSGALQRDPVTHSWRSSKKMV
jgi:hypothetical protein